MKRLLTIFAIALGLTFAAPLAFSVDAQACGAKTTQKASSDDVKKSDTKTKTANSDCKPSEKCDKK